MFDIFTLFKKWVPRTHRPADLSTNAHKNCFVGFRYSVNNRQSGFKAAAFLTVFLCLCMVSAPLMAQVEEDTTKVEREGPEQFDFEQFESPFDTPYQFSVPESEMNRYRLDDFGTTPGFYRRLNYQGFGEFLMPSEERYDPYGEEWVEQINQDLITLLELTFSEESQFLSTIARIGRFLTLGFFEPYEVPISRIDDPDRSHIESGDHNP